VTSPSLTRALSLTVNGETINRQVEPRTHLADFLRGECRLTGTHLGCEHGVCGACTVLLNGVPARSCITYAIGCEQAGVQTVEGFDGDPLMARLRAAFSAEHALQCGFCTPGMLITAYDICRRLPEADEARIRLELSGNLCRCTGYVGIVNAIKRVLAESDATVTPTGTVAEAPPPAAPIPSFVPISASSAPAATAAMATAEGSQALEPGWTRIADGFVIDRDAAALWHLFDDVPRLAACMPGAVLDGFDGTTLTGRMQVRLGPISASFHGEARLERDAERHVGVLSGAGADQRGGSRAKGRVTYRLVPADTATQATRVELTLDFQLQGLLAQFSRSGLVKDFVGRLVGDFAENLRASVAGKGAPPTSDKRRSVSIGALLWAVLRNRIGALFGGRTP